MAKKNDTPPQRYCPDCDLGAEHPTEEGVCPRCGFVFLTSPEQVEWFPSEEGGVEFGVAKDTPLWNYLDELGKYHEFTKDSASDQPAPPRGRGAARRVGINDDEKGDIRLENRMVSLWLFYSDDTDAEEGYDTTNEEGETVPLLRVPTKADVYAYRQHCSEHDDDYVPPNWVADPSVGIGPVQAPHKEEPNRIRDRQTIADPS